MGKDLEGRRPILIWGTEQEFASWDSQKSQNIWLYLHFPLPASFRHPSILIRLSQTLTTLEDDVVK
jgi:hypothetical protein